ncbi:MAG: hypothetical protein IJD04_07255 [Desulfovibrionaceae bacterium]|nr:hypothetical protein [Desulfovibrionaceae bacterium]
MSASRPPGNPGENISEAEIRKQLEDIFKSRDFVASQRLMDFLNYIVDQALAGKDKNIKAYNIAVDVFGAGADFDSQINPLVRTEAVRLRSKLEHYYLLNPDAPVHIAIPKGAYVPVFSRQGEQSSAPFPSREWQLPSIHTSILVAPFETINSSPEGESFNSGLVNEIVKGLIRFNDITVIDQSAGTNSTAPAPGAGSPGATRPAHPPRFILKGALQTQRKHFKLWVTLSDSGNCGKIWAESFNGDLQHDLFETQEIIAEKIVYLIAADFGVIQQIILKEIEAGQGQSSFTHKAQWLYHRWVNRLTPADFRLALAAVDEALSKEPDNAHLMAMLSDLYSADYQLSYGLAENSLEQSLGLALAASAADPECQTAYLALAINYFLREDRTKFLISAERALELNPSSSSAMTTLSSWYGLLGFWNEALELIKKVFQLNPASPGWCHAVLSFYHYVRCDYDKALIEAYKINMPQMLWDSLFRLIAATGCGNAGAAAQAASDLLELYPDFEQNGKGLVAHSIPSQEYVERVVNSLADAGISLK